jgi:hypothetical protein
MAEIAVELEIACFNPTAVNALMTSGAIFGGKSGAAQDTEHLGLDPGKSGLVSKPRRARRKMISELASHLAAQFADRRLARRRVEETRQGGLDAVALQRLDPDVGQHRLARRLAVITAAMPFGITGKSRFRPSLPLPG